MTGRTFTLAAALAATARAPTAGERRQLALLSAGIAHDAIQAGDFGAAAMYLADAVAHVRALRDPPDLGMVMREDL